MSGGSITKAIWGSVIIDRKQDYKREQDELYYEIVKLCPIGKVPSREVVEELGDETVLSKQDVIDSLVIGVSIDEILDKSKSDKVYLKTKLFKHENPSFFHFLNLK